MPLMICAMFGRPPPPIEPMPPMPEVVEALIQYSATGPVTT